MTSLAVRQMSMCAIIPQDFMKRKPDVPDLGLYRQIVPLFCRSAHRWYSSGWRHGIAMGVAHHEIDRIRRSSDSWSWMPTLYLSEAR